MPRVISTIEHTSSLVNGVRFTPDRGQHISEEVSHEVAANFALIPGYSVSGAAPAKPATPLPTTTDAPAKRAAGRPPKAAKAPAAIEPDINVSGSAAPPSDGETP